MIVYFFASPLEFAFIVVYFPLQFAVLQGNCYNYNVGEFDYRHCWGGVAWLLDALCGFSLEFPSIYIHDWDLHLHHLDFSRLFKLLAFRCSNGLSQHW